MCRTIFWCGAQILVYPRPEPLPAPQDEIFKQYTETSALWTMCWMNFWCGAYNLVYLFAATASGWELATFCRRYPEVRLTRYLSINEAVGAQSLWGGFRMPLLGAQHSPVQAECIFSHINVEGCDSRSTPCCVSTLGTVALTPNPAACALGGVGRDAVNSSILSLNICKLQP